MPKKKSAKKAARDFLTLASELEEFLQRVEGSELSDREISWAYEAALIKLSASFEQLMLRALVAAINNDTTQLSLSTGVKFPTHLTDKVCEFIVTGGTYLDFRGRDGLIKTLGHFLPSDHYLASTVKKATYRQALERLIALRNFAAHESAQSKRFAKEAVGVRLSSAGAWTKKQGRFGTIAGKLRELAQEIEGQAPY